MVKRIYIVEIVLVILLSIVSVVMAAPSIDIITPSSPFSSTEGDPQTFRFDSNQTVNISWQINGTEDITETDVTSGNYTNSSSVVGTWNVTAIIQNINGTNSTSWLWTVTADSTPPASVTNLTSVVGMTFINWTWTDPTDADFDKVDIFIDGSHNTFVNKGIQYYNGTFPSNTTHEIAVFSVDNSSNTNWTNPLNNTNTTLPNTNSDGPVSLGSGVVVNFTGITSPGNTSMTVSPTNTWEVPHTSFTNVGNYYDINTTADFSSGYAIVEVPYNPSSFDENFVRLLHLEGGVWKDVFTSVDTEANTVSGNVTSFSPFVAVIPPTPGITAKNPDSDTNETTIGSPVNFTITFDQTVNVSWYVNGDLDSNYSSVTSSFFNKEKAVGTYNLTVIASNLNGSVSNTWNWTVQSKTYFTGDRVWDENRHSSSEYKWNVYSFPGFYYNLDDDVGTEELTIKNIGRSIDENDMIYKTSPEEVGFEYDDFGRYEVIGFMAEKYFAGYTSNTNITGINSKTTLSAKQLHKILYDDDEERTISEGGTLTLKEGYVLKMTAVDIGAGPGQIWISLLKDGGEVDTTVVEGGEEYVYIKEKVGKVSDLPLIAVHFESVFRGREINAAFIEGIFQISESYTTVNSGDNYGEMEVKSVGSSEIEMRNENTIDLSKGSTVDLMGNLQIVVADSDDLRFAMSVERTGTFEARGTIYNATDEWTPMNFGLNVGGTSIGFYYDIDDDVGNESLKVNSISDTTIPEGELVYSTKPQEVSFEHDEFGKYEVMGFLADKYFAGYTSNTDVSGVSAKSALSTKQLHKVLLDDDEERTISEGGTLTLQEGYVLKMTAVDIGAGTGQIWITLLKDGNEVDTDVVAGGENYVYSEKVGKVSDLATVIVHFESVFRGREINAAFIEGIFQISESYTTVNSGDNFGEMEVKSVGASGIEMENENSIDLSPDSVIDLMGDIKFNVADDSAALRFYPFVEVTAEMIANQLVIDTVSKANAGDNISITVRAGGSPVEGATVTLDTEIGQTDSDGVLEYELPKTLVGMYNITATKLGYEKAMKSIEIEKYIDLRLSIDAPAKATQFETISILVTFNGTAMQGATVKYDNEIIGTTDIDGMLEYTLESSAIHTITASKNGYITVSREINVEVPYSEFKALDIYVEPRIVTRDDEIIIRSNITNVGTKADTLPVELLINTTTVDNRSVTLAPGEIKEINFTGNFKDWMQEDVEPGNYTLLIIDKKEIVQVEDKPLNVLLLGGILTGLGAIIIYFVTSKKITVAMVKEYIANLNAETIKEGLRNAPETIRQSLTKAGWKLKDAFNELISKFRK